VGFLRDIGSIWMHHPDLISDGEVLMIIAEVIMGTLVGDLPGLGEFSLAEPAFGEIWDGDWE
jgi:hypothetical protein